VEPSMWHAGKHCFNVAQVRQRGTLRDER
jgi:hypothetical protein